MRIARAAFVLGLAVAVQTLAGPCADWRWVYPEIADDIVDIAYGDGHWVAAVDGNDVVAISDDGVSWRSQPLGIGTPTALIQVAWGQGRFVGVSHDGNVYFSDDGSSWTQQTSDGALDWVRELELTSHGWVAVGGFSDYAVPYMGIAKIALSQNGVEWEVVYSHVGYTQGPVDDVAEGNGILVVVGFLDSYEIVANVLVSTDGRSWQEVEVPYYSGLSRVVWLGDRFLAVGAMLGTSVDGMKWQWQTWEGFGGDTVYDGERLIVLGYSGQGWTSTDGGETWSSVSTGFDVQLKALAAGGGRWAAGGKPETLLISANGVEWAPADCTSRLEVSRLAASPDRVVAVGQPRGGAGPSVVTWRADLEPVTVVVGNAELVGVAWTGERFVAVGKRGIVARSADGLGWSMGTIGETVDLAGVAASSAELVAVGEDLLQAAAFRSSDGGASWVRAVVPAALGMLAVAFVGDRFIAAGSEGTVLESADGREWQRVALPTGSNGGDLEAIASNGRRVVVAGARAAFSTAPGSQWEAVGVRARGLVWDGRRFVGVNDGGYGIDRGVWSSPDGLVWSLEEVPWPANPYSSEFYDVAVLGDLVFSAAPRGRVAVAECPAGLDSAAPYRYLVPAAAHLQGAAGTRWRSDVTVPTAWGYEENSVQLFLLTSGTEAAAASTRLLLRPPDTYPDPPAVILGDVVLETFGQGSAAGAVLLQSDDPLTARSRTFTLAAEGEGTYGQGVPLLDLATERPDVQVVPGLASDDGFRTNIGLVNPGEAATSMTVEVLAADGTVRAWWSESLAPYEYRQRNRVGDGLELWSLRVSSAGEPPVV